MLMNYDRFMDREKVQFDFLEHRSFELTMTGDPETGRPYLACFPVVPGALLTDRS